MRRLSVLLTMLALGACAAPAGAAQNLDGFAAAFPRASRLCERADAGKLGKALKPDARKVKAACARLRERYSSALNAYRTATAPLVQQAKDARRQLAETCRARSRDRTACREAGQATRARMRELRTQMAPHQEAFRKAKQAARKEFWKAIRRLRGGKSLKQDTDNAQMPADELPTDSEIDGEVAAA